MEGMQRRPGTCPAPTGQPRFLERVALVHCATGATSAAALACPCIRRCGDAGLGSRPLLLLLSHTAGGPSTVWSPSAVCTAGRLHFKEGTGRGVDSKQGAYSPAQ